MTVFCYYDDDVDGVNDAVDGDKDAVDDDDDGDDDILYCVDEMCTFPS